MIDERSAGIIMHITSLPSRFGIGDLGPEAYKFADFLARAGQKYWQILPLNPTDPASGNSPYSGLSAFAGNTLLISPELLIKEELVGQQDLENFPTSQSDQVDFEEVIAFKNILFELAYERFENQGGHQSLDFIRFCQEESWWLEDYALFKALKIKYKGVSWNQWPESISMKSQQALDELYPLIHRDIGKEKLLQYLFFKQWEALKDYCSNRKIRFFGDLPFYVGYDSADVWSNKHLFKLDKNHKPITVSGVPPDYFSETGQLWGTPVFLWEDMEDNNFQWWRKRISQNMRLFDLLRLDHFRAFAAYWEVPAAEETAINGSWAQGPGNKFFRHLKQDFPDLPFIAEDLGDIDQDVRDLMQEFDLPGMKVLLFAFGEDLPESAYAPHYHVPNCIVYTGTHDNNTIVGWFDSNDEDDRQRFSNYINHAVDRESIADEMIHMALRSVAQTVVIPMQDYLGLGEEAIMNKPSVARGNWSWRMEPHIANTALAEKIKAKIKLFDRDIRKVKKAQMVDPA